MEIRDIENWLEEMLPMELYAKEWYQKHGKPLPEVLYNSHAKKEFERLQNSNSPFARINPDNLPIITFRLNRIRKLENMDLFLQNQNFIICKHPRYLPEYQHTHNFSELIYVYSGSCQQNFYHGKQKESIFLKKGDFCLIPPNVDNTKAVYDDSIVINILFKNQILRDTLSFLLEDSQLMNYFFHFLQDDLPQDYMRFSTGNDQSIRNTILEMLLEACLAKKHHQKMLFLHFGIILMQLQENYLNTLTFSNRVHKTTNYIPHMIKYLEDMYADFSLENMAATFHLSPTYICHVFKNGTGRTLTVYLQQIRIQAAKNLLSGSAASIGDISNAVGYDDCTHFIRVFKKHVGCTPAQFRKKSR